MEKSLVNGIKNQVNTVPDPQHSNRRLPFKDISGLMRNEKELLRECGKAILRGRLEQAAQSEKANRGRPQQ